MKRLKIKFKPFIFVNDYGEAVLAIQCPKCDFPVSILNPLREIYDDLKTGMIFIRANCSHCKTGSLNDVPDSEFSKIQRFVDDFCVKESQPRSISRQDVLQSEKSWGKVLRRNRRRPFDANDDTRTLMEILAHKKKHKKGK